MGEGSGDACIRLLAILSTKGIALAGFYMRLREGSLDLIEAPRICELEAKLVMLCTRLTTLCLPDKRARP